MKREKSLLPIFITLVVISTFSFTLLSQEVVEIKTYPDKKVICLGVYEAGNKVFVSENGNSLGTLHIYDVYTLEEISTISFPGERVTAMIVHEGTGKLYTCLYTTGGSLRKLEVRNANTGEFMHYLPIDLNTPIKFYLNENLGKLYFLPYISNAIGLYQVDVETDLLTYIPGFDNGPFVTMAVNPVAHEIFLPWYYTNEMYIVDEVTLEQEVVENLGAIGVGVNWNENKIYTIYPMRVYDRDTGTINGIAAVNDACTTIVYSPTSNCMYTSSEVNGISTIIDGESDEFFNLPMFMATVEIAFRHSTNHVYYLNQKYACIYNEKTQLLKIMPLPYNPDSSGGGSQSIGIHQATGRVFLINDMSMDFVTVIQDTDPITNPPIYLGNDDSPGSVFVLDPVSKEVVDKWETSGGGGFPWGSNFHAMAVSPGGGRLYVPFWTEGGIFTYAGCDKNALINAFESGIYSAVPIVPAITPDGSRIYLTNSSSDNVSVIDVINYTELDRITVGNTPWGAAVTPDGSKVYIANKVDNSVSVIDTGSNTVIDSIGVGNNPWGVAVNPSGTKAYIANSASGTVSVIDIGTDTVIATVPVESNPHWLVFTQDGKHVYVSNSGSDTVSILDAGSDTVIRTVSVDSEPEGMCTVPDGSEIYVATRSSVSIINTSIFSVTIFSPEFPPFTYKKIVSVAVADTTSRFAGRVTDSFGDYPIEGAVVRVLQGGVEKGTAATNIAGDYSVFNLKPGIYDIEVEAPGYFTQTLVSQDVESGHIKLLNFILTSQSPPIVVESPNGGESWMVNSTQDITWTTTGTVENVKIAYSTNNGGNWTEIVASTENDGIYPWTVPDADSSQCLIRVSETDGSPSDVSDSVFSIVPIPTITVTSPNGGENWMVGSAQNITWTSIGTVGNVKIEYSTNNGTNWTEITASTVNDGTHPWTVPDTVSSQCLIRVSETGGSPSDISDSVFSIVPIPTITVISPNGGENWMVGSVHNITWTTTGIVGNVKIEYSVNNGENWSEIIASTGNDGSFPWTIPGTVSDLCLIRVSETDGSPSDTSDGVFSILPIRTITVTSPNGGENWDVGSVYDITWTSEGNVENVRIEYSTNGGNNWAIITPSTENDGSYNWNVSATPSDNCLVRISDTDEDGGTSDVSDEVFSIVSTVSGSITLRSPNGGETWVAGLPQEIKWNSTGDINNVTIQYSTDNGTTWKTIAKNDVNNHIYNWVVPDTVSDQCLVRVTSNDSDLDPKPSDVSDAVFSIVLPPEPTVKVTAPNGGEQLVVGSRFTISWYAANTREDVQIEYSINGGETWTDITGAAENNGKYDWTVPGTPSDNCLVRISITGGQPSDVSDGVFSIVSPSPSDITVTSPNGGETWTVGASQEIKWTSTGGIDSVFIDYSKDNGTTWKTIVQTTPNSGSFNWTIPDTVSDECLVRVTANDSDLDPKPSDVSDRVFSIVPPASPVIRVISPNGGEQLVVGSRFNITWYGTNTREDVKIEYSINGGDTWPVIIEATENDGEYDWIIPGTPSDNCLVRISETDGQPVDVSDAVFSIVPPLSDDIIVTAPNGGESWAVGSLQEITWTSTGEINNVFIEYSTDNGFTWKVIVRTTPNTGSFDWTIPGTDTVSDECLVRVTANDDDLDPKPSDVSDNLFSIVPSTGAFRVTSPNGGEEWEVGSTRSITWTNSGDISSVMIEYSPDNGNSWSTIVSSTENSGTYDWLVPGTVSDECLVRVTANDGGGDPTPSDVSDEVFSIVLPSSPTITVIAPNGGEQLLINSIFSINWFSTNSREDVKIEYSINGGDSWTIITDSTENDGDYDWTVPGEPSEICLVRISETDGEPVDISDAVFSIVSPLPGDLTVLTPNGGENLETGSEYNISWTCSGLNNVIIEYSVNNGAAWLTIDKVPADNGSYTWTVPGTPSEMCLVRLTGADSDENPSDVSDEVFIIFDPSLASIEVITPNGGENLGVGEEYYITWASAGVTNVLIEYSTDNGDQWIPIDTVSAIGGRYTWTVPDTPSDSCLIRISGTDSPEDPSDVSDSVFSITSNFP
jgi:YVTN family beta-propeller protein